MCVCGLVLCVLYLDLFFVFFIWIYFLCLFLIGLFVCVCVCVYFIWTFLFVLFLSTDVVEEQMLARARRASRRMSQKTNVSSMGSDSKSSKAYSQMQVAALELLTYFSQRNLDALQRCIRNTLESIRKRITASMMAQYGWLT